MKHQIKTKQYLIIFIVALAGFTANAQQFGTPENPVQPNDVRAPDAVPSLMPPDQFQSPQQQQDNANPSYSNRDDSNPATYDRTKEQVQPPPSN